MINRSSAVLAISLLLHSSQLLLSENVENGRLVIVGGALSPKNDLVYQTMLAEVDDSEAVGIVPLASGVPEESGPLSVQDFQQYAKNPDKVFDTELIYTDLEKAASAETAKILEDCGAIWFTGGDQSRIVAALRPEAGDTLGYQAVLKVLAKGGAVGGSSAGAAMMSDPMIRSGESDEAMLLGATDIIDGPGVCVGKGMGLFAYGLSDQHFLQRGRFGRLLVALEATEQNLGFGISENCALVADLSTETMSVIGNRAVTIIDRSAATREGFNRKNVRVHLLSDGDVFNATTNEATADAAKLKMPSNVDVDSPAAVFPDLWRRNVIGQTLWALANNPSKPIVGTDGNFDYQFSADESTSFYRTKIDDDGGFTAIGVRLDITARDGIEERIEAKKKELENRRRS